MRPFHVGDSKAEIYTTKRAGYLHMSGALMKSKPAGGTYRTKRPVIQGQMTEQNHVTPKNHLDQSLAY